MVVHPRSQVCVHPCECVHTGLVPSDPVPPLSFQLMAGTGPAPQHAFLPSLPLCRSAPAQPEPPRNSAPGGLGPSGHRAIFSWGHDKRSRPAERDLPPFDGGNHGNWQQPQGPFFSVPLSTEPRAEWRRRQKSSEDGGVGIWRAMHRFSRVREGWEGC